MFVTRCVVILAITAAYSQEPNDDKAIGAGVPLAANGNISRYSQDFSDSPQRAKGFIDLHLN